MDSTPVPLLKFPDPLESGCLYVICFFKKTHIYVVAVLAIEISQAGKVLPGN